MTTKFKCKQSGNIVSFIDLDDIASMRKEPHYEEVKDEIKIEKTKDTNEDTNANEENAHEEIRTRVLEIPKQRGRPKKTR